MASISTQSLPPSSPQPHITIHQTDDTERPVLAPHQSAPPAPLQFHSPLRHHKRTPSQHREVKETLDAKARDTSDDAEGILQHTVNQYTIREEIGRGSYGAVHLATDQFGQEYAIKEFSKARLRKRAQSNFLRRPGPGRPHPLAPGRGQHAFYKKQFSRQEDAEAKDALYLIRAEIAIMKKLTHPNLVALIEVLDDPEGDSLYVVMEMCKKGVVMKVTLDGDDPKPYGAEECRTWFRDLILGVEYLHAQGIIHRDIKPDNLLVTEDDVLKIVDFGVSEMFEKKDEMMTNKSAGSPAFIPPELCQAKHGEVSGKAADVWSMGISLHCLKYGKLPFTGNNPLEIYAAIRTEPLTLPDGEDPDLVDLLTRILDKDSATRITLPEIREHPWVTGNGSDPLLSEEENCSDPVETPNELEVNHAFTQKMDHLIYVLRAIKRFKGLVSQSRATTPRTPNAPNTLESDEITRPEPSHDEQASETTELTRQKSVAEEAAKLVDQRKAQLLAGLPSTGGATTMKTEGQDEDDSTETPLFLGIGTGGGNDFATTDSEANLVSDSPTGIDFDVYDRAFETEIKRIRSDRKKNRAWTYMTKLVGEHEIDKYRQDECMIIEAGKSIASNAYTRGLSHINDARRVTYDGTWRKESEEGVQRVIEGTKETKNKFADLVASMTNQLKEKATTKETKEYGGTGSTTTSAVPGSELGIVHANPVPAPSFLAKLPCEIKFLIFKQLPDAQPIAALASTGAAFKHIYERHKIAIHRSVCLAAARFKVNWNGREMGLRVDGDEFSTGDFDTLRDTITTEFTVAQLAAQNFYRLSSEVLEFFPDGPNIQS
ncbi:Pkinase-domain-containing protein [Xylariaceae sp. FL1272]|nr:Pkinase-domain-containing protein [Xylariaceae sp. FL1272]